MKNKFYVHTHHIASHFTNALWPVGSVLLSMYYFYGTKSYEDASYYCFIFSTIGAPLALASGLADWRSRFQGRSTRIFNHKRFFGALFVILSTFIVMWRTTNGAVAAPDSETKYVYLASVYADLGFVVYLGHLGGKFI